MIGVVVFDFDGTLADTMPTLRRIGGDLISTFFGLTPEDADNAYMRTVGRPFSEQLKVLFPQVRDEIHEVALEAFTHMQRADVYTECIVFHRYAKTVCRVLGDHGVVMRVASSTNGSLFEKKLGILNGTDGFKGGVGLLRGKGAKAEKLKSLAATIEPDRVLFVGDAYWDYEQARTAGVQFLGVAHTFQRSYWPATVDVADNLLGVLDRTLNDG